MHPCLIPLVTSISIQLFYYSCIFVLSSLYILTIKAIILLSNLNSFSICSIVSLFIESYAFFKSIAIVTTCSCFLYVSSMHSLRINRLSKIFPPLVNPACSNFPLLFYVMCFSISLPTLVFYMTCQSLLLVSVLFLFFFWYHDYF